jgi:subfamily B ATP-binding cassette protein MsbA
MARKKPLNPTTAPTWPLLRRIGREYLWLHKGQLAWAGLAMLIVAAALGMQAHLIQPLFDNGLIAGKVGVINTVIFAVVLLTVIRGIANYYQLYFMESVGQRLVATLQEQMYAKTLTQPLGWFAGNPTGTLTSRFISDLQRLKYAVTQIFNSGLRDTGTVVGLFINMLYQDFYLTLFTLLIIPMTIIPIRRFGRLSRKYSRVNQESTARMAHHLSQTLQHVRQVQSYAQEGFEKKRMHAQVQEVLLTTLKGVKVRALSSPVVEIIGTVAIALIMLYAGRRIADGTLSPGAFASFMASLVMLSRPLKGLAALNNNLQEGLAAAQRAFELTDAKPSLHDTPGAKPLEVKTASVSFEDITLRYPDGTLALEHFTLQVPAGQTVALVGPSGAGKSSVLNLLPRFYDIAHGTIKIAGRDIQQLTLKSLRQHIALVSQDVAIFDDTIAGNIAYAHSGKGARAESTAIVAAAKAAAAHSFIQNLPQGYATVLGENGLKLSGGQKQRLALARALLKDAPILLLDEATASLDTASERAVQGAIERAKAGRTTFIVAHRLSTIKNADVIVVLEAGKIVEKGTHQQLLKKDGLYAKLWRLQGATSEE